MLADFYNRTKQYHKYTVLYDYILRYNSAIDYIADGHSNQKFYAGKCKDNVAILELNNCKISSNAEISDVINALKNKYVQKVYVCKNTFEPQDLVRVAKKHLTKN